MRRVEHYHAIIYNCSLYSDVFILFTGPEPGCITVPVVLGRKESIIDFVEADMYIQVSTKHFQNYLIYS